MINIDRLQIRNLDIALGNANVPDDADIVLRPFAGRIGRAQILADVYYNGSQIAQFLCTGPIWNRI